MNSAHIAGQIAHLSALLVTALANEEDVDYAAVLKHLSTSYAHQSTALNIAADTAENSDGTLYDTVVYETNRARHLLTTIGEGIGVAAKAALLEQGATAAIIARSTTTTPADKPVTVRAATHTPGYRIPSELATF